MEKISIPTELKGHFLQLYKIALCDGDFSVLELKMLYHFAEDRGIANHQLDELLLKAGEETELIPETFEMKIEYLYDFTTMILADGIVKEDELISLKKYIKLFGFLDENVDALASFLLDSVKAGKTKRELLNELNN